MDFLEFQQDIIVFIDIFQTYEDEQKCLITEISLDKLKQLKKNMVEKYTSSPFRNERMKRWHAHLGKLIKTFIATMKNDNTRPSWIKLMNVGEPTPLIPLPEQEEDNSWMEDSLSETEAKATPHETEGSDGNIPPKKHKRKGGKGTPQKGSRNTRSSTGKATK